MSIEVGNKVPGKVSGITNFGAFIDLGSGKTGLVHISEVSDGYVKDIHDVLSVGDEVTVKVTAIGNDGKIGLSIRKAVDKPQEEARPARPVREHRPSNGGGNRFNSGSRPNQNKFQETKSNDFDSLLSSFLKDSEDRLTSLKRNTEGKRGGRGGRRS